MITYSCLKVLSKDELIRCIMRLIAGHPNLAREFKCKMIETFQDKINNIQKMQEACDLTSPDGKINFFKLQKDYEDTQAAFSAICSMQKGNHA